MNTKRVSTTTTIASVIVIFSSCWTSNPMPYYIDVPRQKENVYYTPSTSNAPLLSNKGDVTAKLNYSASTSSSAADVQGAYMITNKVGITSTVSIASEEHVRFPRAEFAAGYVLPSKNGYHFETYAGFGAGTIHNQHATGSSKLRFNQFFIQPAVGVHNEKNTLQFAFVSRFARAHFKMADTSFAGERESHSANQFKILANDPNHLFWEPGFTVRFGWQSLLFNLNYTRSAHLGKTDFERGKDNFAAGVCLKLNTAEKKVINFK